MSDITAHVFDTIDRQYARAGTSTRRKLIKTTALALGSMGLLSHASDDAFAAVRTDPDNSIANLATVAATAEALATIVTTVAAEKLGGALDQVTLRNIRAAAQQEKSHFELLTSAAVGAKPATTAIWVPDDVFSSPASLLSALVVSEQVFINGYLLGITIFARAGTRGASRLARYCGEILATEAVHRALALQSLGRLGNDRVYAKFGQREAVAGLPTTGHGGFYKVLDAVGILESAGFGFGKPGSRPGTRYEYLEVAARTPVDPDVNTVSIS